MKYKLTEEQYETLIESQKKKNKLEKQLLLDIDKIRQSLYVEKLISDAIVDKVKYYKKKHGNIVNSIIDSLLKQDIISFEQANVLR